MNAAPPNRSPNTATLPEPTVKSAEPRFPAIALRPGRSLSTLATLLLAARGRFQVPMTSPFAFRTVMPTVVATTLGFTIATDVVKRVSSQIRVALVENALESGTTAS